MSQTAPSGYGAGLESRWGSLHSRVRVPLIPPTPYSSAERPLRCGSRYQHRPLRYQKITLKGRYAGLADRSALESWNGESMIGAAGMNFRWRAVSGFLEDLQNAGEG